MPSLFVYGNWAAYDELSDGIELTEELAMRQLGELLRLRRSGVRFDAYLMDAFWFARDGGFREWRKPHWPDGPGRWLAACQENGLLPGMWFTANTLCHLDPAPAWRDSVDAKGWGMCLFAGGFLADFLEILDYWYGRGVRIFKFDFAEFGAVPAALDGQIAPVEARAQNIAAFRSAFLRFRIDHAEAILLGYNGFEDMECMDRTDRPFERFIDPAWLDIFDSLYCGDPRPADVPCLSFWRSVDIYSDHMARAFEASGIPLDRIENCGFMAGNTGTCYWRRKSAWQGMLLLSLARGGRIHVAYGDLSQFSDQDAAWWAMAQALYSLEFVTAKTGLVRGPSQAQDDSVGGGDTVFSTDGGRPPSSEIPDVIPSEAKDLASHNPSPTSIVSFGGIPGRAEPYGWRQSSGGKEILTIVNPSLVSTTFELPIQSNWRLVTHDARYTPVVTDQSLQLAGGQMAVISNADVEPLRVWRYVKLNPGDLELIAADDVSRTENSVTVRIDQRGYVVFRQFAADGSVKRPYATDAEPYAFRVIDSRGRRWTRFPRRVWSGTSWGTLAIGRCTEPFELTIESTNPGPCRLEVILLRRTERES